jgi:hypothetical protein
MELATSKEEGQGEIARSRSQSRLMRARGSMQEVEEGNTAARRPQTAGAAGWKRGELAEEWGEQGDICVLPHILLPARLNFLSSLVLP